MENEFSLFGSDSLTTNPPTCALISMVIKECGCRRKSTRLGANASESHSVPGKSPKPDMFDPVPTSELCGKTETFPEVLIDGISKPLQQGLKTSSPREEKPPTLSATSVLAVVPKRCTELR